MSEKDRLLKEIYGNLASVRRLMATFMQEEYGLPASQCEILFMVHHEGAMPLKNLAKAMQLTPGAITQLVEALEQAGYVRRQPSLVDRRITTVLITEAGLLKIAHSQSAKARGFKAVLAKLTEDELRTMNTIQHKMIGFLKEHTIKEQK